MSHSSMSAGTFMNAFHGIEGLVPRPSEVALHKQTGHVRIQYGSFEAHVFVSKKLETVTLSFTNHGFILSKALPHMVSGPTPFPEVHACGFASDGVSVCDGLADYLRITWNMPGLEFKYS